jgi:ABC-type molybdate transport system ATPase subunit
VWERLAAAILNVATASRIRCILNGSLARVGNLSFQLAGPPKGHSRIAFRPEDVRLFNTPPEGRPANLFKGVIGRISNQGGFADLMVDVSDLQIQSILATSTLHTMNFVPGNRVFIKVAPEDIHFI